MELSEKLNMKKGAVCFGGSTFFVGHSVLGVNENLEECEM